MAILKWDIPYHLPYVSVLMWQIKIGISQFISHIPKNTLFLMWQYFFGIYRYIPFFSYTRATLWRNKNGIWDIPYPIEPLWHGCVKFNHVFMRPPPLQNPQTLNFVLRAITKKIKISEKSANYQPNAQYQPKKRLYLYNSGLI